MKTSPKAPRFQMLVTAILFAASCAFAGPIVVPNFSFESPDVEDAGAWVSAIPNWTNGSSAQSTEYWVFDPGSAIFPGAAGDNSPLPGTANGGQAGGIILNTSVIGTIGTLTSGNLSLIQPNTHYTLTVAIGESLLPVQEANLCQVLLLANGLPVTLGSTTGTLLTVGSFTDLSVFFTTLASGNPLVGSSLQIQLAHTKTSPGTGTQPIAFFDNVRLDATEAPEPSTTLLLLCGTSLCIRRNRRTNLIN